MLSAWTYNDQVLKGISRSFLSVFGHFVSRFLHLSSEVVALFGLVTLDHQSFLAAWDSIPCCLQGLTTTERHMALLASPCSATSSPSAYSTYLVVLFVSFLNCQSPMTTFTLLEACCVGFFLICRSGGCVRHCSSDSSFVYGTQHLWCLYLDPHGRVNGPLLQPALSKHLVICGHHMYIRMTLAAICSRLVVSPILSLHDII